MCKCRVENDMKSDSKDNSEYNFGPVLIVHFVVFFFFCLHTEAVSEKKTKSWEDIIIFPSSVLFCFVT